METFRIVLLICLGGPWITDPKQRVLFVAHPHLAACQHDLYSETLRMARIGEEGIGKRISQSLRPAVGAAA